MKAVAIIQQRDEYPNMRRVYREWPVLEEEPIYVSRAALASGFKRGVKKASTLRVTKEVSLDIDQLKTDMQSPSMDDHIASLMQLAQFC